MTPAAESAIRAMGQCIASDMAEHHARLALERGATHAEITAAWAEWRALNAPQTVTSTAHPDTRCSCPHRRAQHDGGTGECLSLACGCVAFAPGGRRWTA